MNRQFSGDVLIKSANVASHNSYNVDRVGMPRADRTALCSRWPAFSILLFLSFFFFSLIVFLFSFLFF